MSDVQPPEPTPPPQFVAYPRGLTSVYGSADRLEALGSGYFGLNLVFLANVVLGLLVYALLQISALAWAIGFLILVVLITFLFYRQNVKIALGMGWSSTTGVVVSILAGLSSVLCCGIIGYVIVQQIASAEMKKYGLSTGFFGVKKRDWQAMVEQMRQLEASPAPAPPFVPPPSTPPF